MSQTFGVRIGVALGTLVLSAAGAPLEPNAGILKTWLSSFNSGDRKALERRQADLPRAACDCDDATAAHAGTRLRLHILFSRRLSVLGSRG